MLKLRRILRRLHRELLLDGLIGILGYSRLTRKGGLTWKSALTWKGGLTGERGLTRLSRVGGLPRLHRLSGKRILCRLSWKHRKRAWGGLSGK